MRDLSHFRRRLFLAMGIVTAAAGCGETSSGTPAAADSAAATDAVVLDTAASEDVAVLPDSAAADSAAADAPVAPADVADVVAVSDVPTADAPVADSGSGDTTAADAVGADSAAADAGVDAASDVTAPVPTCSNGKGSTQCFTAKQLKYNVDLTFMNGGPIPDDKIDFLLPPEGCPPAERVYEGCCNKAKTGPVLVGTKCCYGFCVGSCCGRPLRIDGELQLAPVIARADWLKGGAGEQPSLDAAAQQAIAAAWREDARMEHASIASFNQFSLDLLAVGAPAELVRDAQRAAMDEVDHAERCFGIVAKLTGALEGPGPLVLPAARNTYTLAQIAADTARDGCVGETIAALLAGVRAHRATDPQVASALTTIAADEARHAELGWRFVKWAVQAGGAEVATAVSEAFELAMADPPLARVPAGVDLDAWAAWGLLDGGTHTATVRAALRQVIRPCAAELCGADVGHLSDVCVDVLAAPQSAAV
ncbi:MAG: ferritin-like domain-containing protein [Myxococcales bacterium]|nr:ferritin-like domain-containing protein [Myxococcales bacterium]